MMELLLPITAAAGITLQITALIVVYVIRNEDRKKREVEE